MSRTRWTRSGTVAALLVLGLQPWAPSSIGALATEPAPAAAADPSASRDDNIRTREEQYFYMQRAAPGTSVPDGALGRARREAEERVHTGAIAVIPQGAASPDTVEGPWVPIGPRPIGSGLAGSGFGPLPNSGRVTALAVDPTAGNTVYLGSATGGVWKTTNGGTDWTPLTDNQPSLSIGAIAIDPNNVNFIYAGLGEANYSGDSYYGFGILKSTDAGVSWTLANPPWLNRHRIARIAVDPNNSNYVYAATTHGVVRSNDAGSTWQPVCLDLGPCNAVTDLVIDSGVNPSTVIAVHGDINGSQSNGVYRCQTCSISFPLFQKVGLATFPSTNVGRISLSMSRTVSPVLYAAVHNFSDDSVLGVWKSTDRGSTWVQTAHPENSSGTPNSHQAWYDLDIEVSPFDSSLLYVLAVDAFKSTNGGTTWSRITNSYIFPYTMHADQHALAMWQGDATRLYLGNDGGVYQSINGASTWSNRNQTLSITQFYRGAAHPTNVTSAFGGTQDNGSLSYENSLDWFRSVGGDGGYAAIDFNAPNNVYATTQDLGIVRSTTGPRGSFSSATSGIGGEPRQFIAPMVMSPNQAQTLFAGTTRMYRSINGAVSWSQISPVLASQSTWYNAISAIGPSPSALSTIYAGTGSGGGGVSKLWMTTDSVNWTDRSAGLPNRTVTGIAVHPTDPITAYVTVSGFDTGHVWKTTSGGASWTDVSGALPNAPANAVVVDPADGQLLYLGTDVGVYRSADGGATWASMNTALPNAVVNDLALNSAGTRLFAFTHGRGVYAADRAAGLIGGKGFRINTGPPISQVQMDWSNGLTQSGYVIYRTDYTTDTTVILPPGGPLPAGATSYIDPGPLTDGDVYCDQLVALSGSTPIGTSDVLCLVWGSRSISGTPRNFGIQLNQGNIASLSWRSPSTGDQDGYYLYILPLDGTDPRFQVLPGAATSTTDDTAAVPTCYVLYPTSGDQVLGQSDWLCGFPGQATVTGGAASQNLDSLRTFARAQPSRSAVP
jgi:photosystem II stability/assembly factor-like uncharacterized protein